MNGYTKLFGSIIHSTVWREAPHVKIVWVTMLAMVDQYGVVEASVPGLADAARVSLEEAEEALAKFLSPDPYSRSKVAEGRRIEVVEGGWKLINHPHYRDKMSIEERRERDAERKRTARANRKTSAERPLSADSPQTSAIVRDVSHTDQIRSDQKPPISPQGGPVLGLKSPHVEEVLAYWALKLYPGKQPKLDDARRKRVKARLADGFTVDQLKRAIDGALRDDWIMGRREGSPKGGYRDVKTVLRDVAQVERLIELAPKQRPSTPPIAFALARTPQERAAPVSLSEMLTRAEAVRKAGGT